MPQPILSKICSKLKNKKALFLDLDNTLYKYDPCQKAGLKAAYFFYTRRIEKISQPVFLSAYEQARRVIHKRLAHQAASHSRLLYFQTLLEQCLGRTYFQQTLQLEQAYWNAYLKTTKRYSWVLPLLKYCRSNKIRIALITNLTAQIQFQKVRRLGLENWIDFMVTSEEAGIEKPHPEIFKLALKKAACHPNEVLMAGDLKSDSVPWMDFVKV